MTTPGSIREARRMVTALRSLRVTAPSSVGTATRVELGLMDAWTEVPGPVGPLFVAWRGSRITSVERAGDAADFEVRCVERSGVPIGRLERMPAALERQLRRRLRGEPTEGPQVELGGLTDFEQAVLRKTMEIPYGEIRPYAWVAREIGRPRAVRAVGTALAGNPIPFVIPCHRVVRADGRMGEYGAGGPEVKRALLRAEGVDPDDLERLADQGVRYLGSATTGIFCYPSCRHARRISARHRVVFRNGEEAAAAGFRACLRCRPLESAVFAA